MEFVRGKVTGQITLTSFDLNVVWPDGKGGNYKGTIPADGKVTGQTTDAIFGLGGITGVAPLKCIADPECKLYADIATAKATEFKNLRCGGPYEGRWTLDHRQHSDWCMGQPLSSPPIASEANTRTTELDACKARVAGCDDYAKEGVAMGTEFLNLNCGELPIALSTDFDQQKGLCLNTPTESFITSQRDFRKKALEECKQRIAKNTPPTPAEIPAAPVPVPPATGPQACAVIPVEQDPAAQPVPQGNGLSVSKQAVSKDCSGANGCEFKVTVENTGKDPVNAVTIIDTTTGDGELNLPADDLAVAPKAPWNCARGVPTQCTLQQALPPGAKSEFNIGFKPGAKATAKTLKNCVNAEIAAAAPQDAQPANTEKKAAPACDSLPLTAPPGVPGKIAVVKTGLSCSGAPQVCDFTVAIVNGTDKPLDDTVEFTDELTGDGAAAANAALTSVPEPWTCPKDAQGFKCSAKLQLDAAGGPNAIKNFTFSATLGAGSEAVKEIKNCATMEGLPPSCASLPLAHSHLLRMQKLASDCTLADDKNSESCEFYVMIRNDGSVAYNGPLSFTDLLTGAGQGSVSSSATTAPSTWTCIPGTGTGTTDCSIPSTTIEPGKGPLVILNIRPNTTAKSYQNCATITGPGSIGSDHPSDCVSLNSVMQPPGVPGKVSVIKTGTSCSGSPPVCSFTITVANGTDQPINGPVEFTDELTGDGAPFANAAVTPSEPWTCAKEGQGFKCTATLQLDATGGPNAVKRFSFAATLGDGSNSVKEMKNCATLAGETPSCASLPLANGPLLRVEKLGFDCDLAPDKKSEVCQFAISIRNDGTAPYTGPLTYGDTFTPGGGNQGVPKGWSCDAVGCSVDPSPVTIDPGKDVSALFLMRPALTTATSFQNCATLLDPAAAVSDHATDCVTLTSAFTTSTLTAIKVSTSNGICDLKGSCPFRIVVRNDGPAVFQGNLRVHDGVFETSSKGVAQSVPGKIEAVPSADWTCTNSDARGIDCTPVAAKKVMQVGGTLSIDVLVTPGPGWQKNDILENCVAAFGGDGPAGSSCAEVKLDPFAVKIAKSGDQACKPGSECRFTLDIFNPGPIVHHAPVTVSDNLAGLSGAKIVSITQVSGKQAFPCSPAPTSLPFSCSGRMDLEIGDHNVYAMVVQLPAEAPGQGWFSNCASVSAPETTTVGQAATGGAPSENSCRVVTIENACTGGMELTKDGRCACPPGTSWDGKSCSTPKSDGVGGTNETAPPPPEKQKTEKQKIVCPPDRPVVSHGNCCPETYEYRDKKCRCPKGKVVIKGLCQVPPKPAPQEPPKEKTCPPNTVLQNGNCRPIACPPGTIGVPPICVQQGQKKEKEKPKEEDCPPGYRKLSKANKYGALCEPIDQGPPKCPADKPNGTPPNCCAPGTRFTEGFCYPDKCSPGWTGLPPHCQPPAQQQQPQPTGPSPKCAPPLIGTPPDCHCPGGYSFDNESKKCERNVQ